MNDMDIFKLLTSLSDHFRSKITPRDPEVKKAAEETRKNELVVNGTHLAIAERIFNYFDFVALNIRPSDYNVQETPSETLRLRSGNCRSKSFLLASMLEVEGYKTQITLAGNHMAIRVFVPIEGGWGKVREMDYALRNYIAKRYGYGMGIDRELHEQGISILLDPTLSRIPGEVVAGKLFKLVFDIDEKRVLNTDGELIARLDTS